MLLYCIQLLYMLLYCIQLIHSWSIEEWCKYNLYTTFPRQGEGNSRNASITISRKKKKSALRSHWQKTSGFTIRKLNKCTCSQDPSPERDRQAHGPALVCPPYVHLCCFSERVATRGLYHSWAFNPCCGNLRFHRGCWPAEPQCPSRC